MAKSLTQIQSQIHKLQKEAEAIKSAVVARIRKELAQHGLTAEDLFGGVPTAAGQSRGAKGKAASKTAKKTVTAAAKPPKYADGAGNVWHGMGKRPAWIHEALGAGRALEEFLVGAAPKPAIKKATAAKKTAAVRKPAAKKAAKTSPRKAGTKRAASKKAPAKAKAAPAES